MITPRKLIITDHDRGSAGLTYIYPVLSRRSGGLSIGVNLNPNNACNWRCIYCQVPNLQRGGAPAVDAALLEKELHTLLADVLDGDFYDRYGVPAEQRRICDIAFSGNGEPTSARTFEQCVELVGKVAGERNLAEKISFVLISNGSLMHQIRVQRGVAKLALLGGELWFKLDSVTDEGRKRINDASLGNRRLMDNMKTAAALCPTWLQTCVFTLDGMPSLQGERNDYLRFLATLPGHGIELQGVLLYGLARPSMQAEASRLAPLPAQWLESFADEIRRLGLDVKVSV